MSRTTKARNETRREWLRRNQPSMDALQYWVFDSLSEAACDCGQMIEHDGYCEHGNPSWVREILGV